MPLYSGQVLRVDLTSGETSATYLTVTDDDGTLQSNEAGTVYDLCGTDLPTPPIIDNRVITGTLLDGSSYSYTVGHFAARGKDFYLLPTTIAPEAVATVTTSTSTGPLPLFPYFSHGLTYDDAPLYTGFALTALLTGSGKHRSVGVDQVAIMDDDGLIQSATTETGSPAQIFFGTGSTSYDFAVPDSGTQMSLVKVFYQGTQGNGSLTALYYTIDTDAGLREFFLPQSGSFELTEIFGISRIKVLDASPEGISYTKLGPSANPYPLISGESGQFISGTFMTDDMQGNGGNDTLVGGMGADRIDGGTGHDIVHGGAQNDTLLGAAGNDALYGGNDRDRMDGGDGNDTLVGNWGNDTLLGGNGDDKLAAGSDNDAVYGGAGRDQLIGFEGNDRLYDGTGQDVFNGGTGADVFVLSKDGDLDRILDFQDGIDLLDLTTAFATLTITTLKPGQVQIDTGSDVLIVQDTARTLTAADFTAADFL